MAISLTAAYIAQVKAGNNNPDTILQVELDSGTVKWGQSIGNGFSDVQRFIKSVKSIQNKIDTKKSVTSRGSITFVISGRDNFKNLIRDEFLKNRRVTRHDGFIAPGFAFSDYAPTFTGLISEWSRRGDELTVTVTDDLAEAQKKIPVANATKTQTIDFTGSGAGMNPVDIMQSIIKDEMGIDASLVDDTQFDSEQDLWLNTWLFSRVLTEPKEGNVYLNELMRETNSFIIHDGELISYKVFAPPVPHTSVEAWTDDNNVIEDSLSCNSGYADHFFNRVIFYYDYDESGSDNEDNFESVVIDEDSVSQGSSLWDEIKTRVIKAKWIRSFTFGQPTTVLGVVIYHASFNNGAGDGTLTFTFDGGGEHTLKWTPPGGTIGEAVTISKDGKFQVFGADETKYIRVMVTSGSLAGSSQTDSDITITALNGTVYTTSVARKILSRYRDPSTVLSFDVDINNVAYDAGGGPAFIKPTDFKDLTTDEALEKGLNTWTLERLMLTSVRPDFTRGKVKIEAIETKMDRLYGFIGHTGRPDWDSATDADQEHAYIGDGSNQLGADNDLGFSVW